MIYKHTKIALLLVVWVVIATEAPLAEIPNLMNYQGFLTDTVGDTVPDGNYSVTFRIYNDSLAGVVLWDEGRLVTVQGGLFSALLGSITPIPDSAFDGPNRWLGVQIGLDPEISPRSRLVTTPFSFRARKSDTSVISLDKTIDASELISGELDTTLFSAISDLMSEDKIGTNSDQVSAGDHTHAIGSINVIHSIDRTSVFVGVGMRPLLRTIVIPANEIGNFLRVHFTGYIPEAGAALGIEIEINGTPSAPIGGLMGEESFQVRVFVNRSIIPNVWQGGSNYSSKLFPPFSLDPTQEVTISIYGIIGGVAVGTIQLSHVLVEYGS